MYGEVVRHDKLDKHTHDILYDMFDRANLTAIAHLAMMTARRRILDKKGNDTYLTEEGGRRVKVPLTLIQGMANGLFRPRGARETHEWLLEHGGGGTRALNQGLFKLVPIDRYGHLDTFIGKDAHRDTFPEIICALER